MGTVLKPPTKLTPLAEVAILAGRVPTDHEWNTWVIEGGAMYMTRELRVEVPDHFTTDFASIPWIFRWWQTGFTGPQRTAAYFHDYMYSGTNQYTRKLADDTFRDVMQLIGRGPRRFLQRWLMWAALRSPFGAIAYRSGQKKYREDPFNRIFR
jgi:hypothetical protein